MVAEILLEIDEDFEDADVLGRTRIPASSTNETSTRSRRPLLSLLQRASLFAGIARKTMVNSSTRP